MHKISEARYKALKTILETKTRRLREDELSSISRATRNRQGGLVEEIDIALSEDRKSQLRRLDEAKRQLEDGDYGICCSCFRDISENRLKALPFTRHCKDCDDRADHNDKIERARQNRRQFGILFQD